MGKPLPVQILINEESWTIKEYRKMTSPQVFHRLADAAAIIAADQSWLVVPAATATVRAR